jgi:hypothetical protein
LDKDLNKSDRLNLAFSRDETKNAPDPLINSGAEAFNC